MRAAGFLLYPPNQPADIIRGNRPQLCVNGWGYMHDETHCGMLSEAAVFFLSVLKCEFRTLCRIGRGSGISQNKTQGSLQPEGVYRKVAVRRLDTLFVCPQRACVLIVLGVYRDGVQRIQRSMHQDIWKCVFLRICREVALDGSINIAERQERVATCHVGRCNF